MRIPKAAQSKASDLPEPMYSDKSIFQCSIHPTLLTCRTL